MIWIWRHLVESTVVCCLLSVLAFSVPSGARRHAVWMSVAAKFAVPTVLLAGFGSKLAAAWPPGASVTYRLIRQVNAGLHALGWADQGVTLHGHRTVFLAATWFSGTVVMVALWFRSWRRSKGECEPAPAHVEELFNDARKLFRVANVEMRVCQLSTAAALCGVLRPTLLVSKDLLPRLSLGELQAIFAHELTHARRRDNLAAALVHAVACLFWFHPLPWFAARQMRRERECACDDSVLASGIDRETYLSALGKASLPFKNAPAGVSAMGKTDLGVRLDRMCTERRTALFRIAPPVFAASLLLLMTIFPLASGYCEECVSNGSVSGTSVERRK